MLERTLTIESRGQTYAATLRIAPAELLENGRWCCKVSITYLIDEPRSVYGRDQIDAFRNALTFLAMLISGTIEDGVQIWWEAKGDQGGFA